MNLTENSTMGIDLSKDWTNTSLTPVYTERPSGLYSLNREALWFDHERNVIYSFGGDNRFGTAYRVLFDSIQGFTPDGKGGGEWKQVLGPVSEKPFPFDLHGTSGGRFANDVDDAYYLAGYISTSTSPVAPDDWYDNVGLLKFNFKTLTMTNLTSAGLISAGLTIKWGVLLDIPIYGSDGVLLAFGGSQNNISVGLNVINIFDKKMQKWYQQFAGGDVPQPRVLFCAVGVYGKEHSSYEM